MNQASDSMIRSPRSFIRPTRLIFPFLVLLSLLPPANLAAQNIYDAPHSRDFAQYLMQSHQFTLASAEWERVLFFTPGDTAARLNLIRSYRLSDHATDGWNKLNQWYPTGTLPRPFSLEAARLTLIRGDFAAFGSVLGRSDGLTPPETSDLKLGAWLMEGAWIRTPVKSRVTPFDITAADPRLTDLYAATRNIHRKSPAAAVALSAVIPGMGKIYSHDWKDGMFSLLFVATNAWQSYRGFSKNGVSSMTGWIFGGLAAGFYSANLFGSWKSARTYNATQTDRIRHEAENIIFIH